MPVRFYSEIKTLEMRALQVFNILIGCAHRRETLTYKLLAQKVGHKGAGIFAQRLEMIMRWCADNKLPPLTVLVVNDNTGVPGSGLTSTESIHSDQERVFKFNWYDLVPPTAEEMNRYKSLVMK